MRYLQVWIRRERRKAYDNIPGRTIHRRIRKQATSAAKSSPAGIAEMCTVEFDRASEEVRDVIWELEIGVSPGIPIVECGCPGIAGLSVLPLLRWIILWVAKRSRRARHCQPPWRRRTAATWASSTTWAPSSSSTTASWGTVAQVTCAREILSMDAL